jgi:uridine kinase
MRILITGAAGAGTTTLGKAVASKMGWNFIDADDYYWLPTKPPYQAQRDHSSRLEMILDEFDKHENSVVAGSIMNWGSQLEDFFDLIVFLYLDESIRVERLKIREKKELGHADPEFLKWASEYDIGPSYGRSLIRHKQWLSERKCKILKLEGDLSVQQRCELLIEALPNKPQKSAI